MRLGSYINPLTYIILVLHVFVPILDCMACAHCMGSAPFRGETTIGHLQAPPDDVIYSPHDGTAAKAPGEQAAKSLCSICANVLMGTEVFLPQVHISVAQWHGPCAVPALSELHSSINKPPQNPLA